MTALAILTGPAGAAVLVVAVACGLHMPVRQPAPSLARRAAESLLDDHSWRYDILRRQHYARDMATARAAFLLTPDPTAMRVFSRLYGHDTRPADPASVWSPSLVGAAA